MHVCVCARRVLCVSMRACVCEHVGVRVVCEHVGVRVVCERKNE